MISTKWPPLITQPLPIAAAPWLILAGFVSLLAFAPSRPFAERLLLENHPVELLAFILLILATVLAAMRGERIVTVGFYATFALLSFVVAMEDIAWGQEFFHFETPDFFKDVNVQGQLTLHNIGGNNSAMELVAFGAAGLVGLALSWFPELRKITPPPIMFSWFVAIGIAGSADAFTDQSELTQC